MHFSTSLFVATGLTSAMVQAGYTIADDYMDSFFDKWDFFTGDDPTNGYVNYVSQDQANSNGYTKKNDDGSIYLGVDYNNVASGRGRDSVRISTKKTYTHMLAVVDIGHMPGGICGTWPAFWSFGNGGDGWPSQGEIDIIEGANDQSQNYLTLHSSPGCSIASNSKSLVQSVTQNCDTQVDGNVGCSFHDPEPKSYGSGFNSNGGGVYAMKWSSTGVNMWFFPRGAEPQDILGDSPNPSNWGDATSTWGGDSCDWDSHFMEHNLIFDTTFCGDWGANTFDSCSAKNNGQTCQQFVQNNPSAFKDAYWQVNALKVYQENGQSNDNPSPSSTSASPSSISSPAAVSSSSAYPQPSSFATSSTAASSGGAFLQTPKATEQAPTPSTPAASPVAPAPSSQPIQENPDGGIFVPAASAAAPSPSPNPPSSLAEAGPGGAVIVPGQPIPSPTIDVVEEAADGTVYDEARKRSPDMGYRHHRQAVHLRRHSVRDVKV